MQSTGTHPDIVGCMNKVSVRLTQMAVCSVLTSLSQACFVYGEAYREIMGDGENYSRENLGVYAGVRGSHAKADFPIII